MSRVLPGVLLAGGWILLLFFGPPWLFWAVVVVGAGIGLHEFFQMTMPSLVGPRRAVVLLACLLPVLTSLFGQNDFVLAGLTVSLLAVAVVALQGYTNITNVLGFLTCSVFGTVYVAFCTAHLVLIRHHPQGVFWLVMLIAIVAGSDTGAYYAGRAFGRRKLFPQISPKKTVAGGVGGLLAGVGVAELVNLLLAGNVHPLILLGAAAALVLIGIAGDLTESMIKRSVNVKDSGTILAGHGGILDRADSLLLTAPVLYLFLYFGIL